RPADPLREVVTIGEYRTLRLSDCDQFSGRFTRSDRAAARSLQAGELLGPSECRDLLAPPDLGVLDLIERVNVQAGHSHGRILEDRGEPVEELPRVVAAGFDHAREGRRVLAQEPRGPTDADLRRHSCE